MDRRKRQFRLFLAAVVMPAVLLSLLTFRFLRQDEELSKQRAGDDRAAAAEQARLVLTAGLETIRLQEVNRRIGKPESGSSRVPVDSAIVFATPWNADGMVLPWESTRKPHYPSARFAASREQGELLEFRSKDFAGAANAYRRALSEAQQPEEACEAQLRVARVLTKAEKSQDALPIYRAMLQTCGQAVDDAGMPFAFYAAERLTELKLDVSSAQDYLIREVQAMRLRPLPQIYMIRSLLQSIGNDAANQALNVTSAQIADFRQAMALSKEFQQVQAVAGADWLAYGDEPWLLRWTPASSSLPPLFFAVSSRKVAPPGTTLVSQKTPQSYSLGAGFAKIEVELDPSRSFPGQRSSALIPVAIILILAMTILGGYLLLHGINRDLQTAEMRSQFVASVSHELKTPLTAIRMFAETLVLGRTPNEQARVEYLETIMSESERLSRLVDNVLDFSKIEQGKKIYQMRPTALPNVVRSAARAMQYPLAEQGFDLKVSIDDKVPSLVADADALEQAILNLLSNAMKYSGDSRQIDLCCGRRNGDAVIDVTDRGIGIESGDQARIFEKFYRVRSTTTELIAGTGLGLTLVKHIAQAHGGSVDVKSASGQGSTFSIRIPAASPEVFA